MTIERNGHTYATGEDLGFERQYTAEAFAIMNAKTDAAFPVPEDYPQCGMSQRLWLIGQCVNAAANTLGMGADDKAIARKAIGIADSILIRLAQENCP